MGRLWVGYTERGLQICADAEGDELYFGDMGFHIGLEEEVVGQAVAEHYLRIKPAIRVACAAGIEEIVGVEDTFVLYSACGGVFGIGGGFEFLDGVKQVEAHVEACGEVSDDELRL